MRFASLLLLFLLFTQLGNAQNDSIVKKQYTALYEQYRTHKNTDTIVALTAARNYLLLAKKENNTEEHWRGYMLQAELYSQHKELNKGVIYADSLVDFAETNKLEELYYNSYVTAGINYLSKGLISGALKYLNKALVIAEANNNLSRIQVCIFYINTALSLSGDYNGVITSQREMMQRIKNADTSLVPEKRKRDLIFLSEMSLADSYIRLKSPDSAYFYSNKVLSEALERYDSCLVKATYWQLGAAEILMKNYDNARRSLDYSKRYCKPLKKFDSLLLSNYYAKIYAGKGQYKKVIESLEGGLKAYPVSRTEEGYMDDYYKVLANAYKEEGDLTNANKYFEKYINTTTELGKIKDTITNSFRAVEIREFQKELELLNEEKNKSKSATNYVLLVAAAIILLLLFVLLKFYRNKKQNEAKFQALLAKIRRAENPGNIINTKDEVLEERTTNDVPEQTVRHILKGLSKLEEKEFFLDKDCSSYTVAKKINTNTSYLSKVINAHFGKNFNTYINDLRINYAIVRLKNDVIFRSYSIQSIAEDLGYKSADSFSRYFKKQTGLNPSFYIKEIKNIA